MRKLRAEMHWRMLGKRLLRPPGRPGLPLRIDLRVVHLLQTPLEFRPTFERQRDDAAEKGQVGRLKIFDGLLTRLEQQSS